MWSNRIKKPQIQVENTDMKSNQGMCMCTLRQCNIYAQMYTKPMNYKLNARMRMAGFTG